MISTLGPTILVAVHLAVAQSSSAPTSADAVARVTACAAIQDNASRLSCYDREAASLARARASGEILVVNRQQISATRRSLFGLTLPNLGPVFGKSDEGPREIEARIVTVSNARSGHHVFVLDDQSVWAQTESASFSREPRAGMPIRIRRGAMGSYLANVDGQRGIRVARRQ